MMRVVQRDRPEIGRDDAAKAGPGTAWGLAAEKPQKKGPCRTRGLAAKAGIGRDDAAKAGGWPQARPGIGPRGRVAGPARGLDAEKPQKKRPCHARDLAGKAEIGR